MFAFEWMGHSDYLGYWRNGAAVRKYQNVTSTDASGAVRDCGEVRETLLSRVEIYRTLRRAVSSMDQGKSNSVRTISGTGLSIRRPHS